MISPGPGVGLVLQALRRRYGGVSRDRVAEAAALVQDWDAVFRVAHIHAVTPLLHQGLTDVAIPDPARTRLEDDVQANRVRNLALTAELARLLDRFRRDGLRAVPYKGPVLAAQAYGDVALREFVDLDILLRPDEVDRARVLMQADRYREPYPLTPRRWRHMLANGHDLKLTRDERHVVELQWAVINRTEGARPELEPMLERATTTDVAGRPMPTLAAEDLLLTLCVHGSVHLWERLAWACDVAELLRARPGLDVELAGRRAAEVGARRVLMLGVEMAGRITGHEPPPRLRAAAAADPTVQRLADDLVEMTLARTGDGPHHGDAPAGTYLRLLLAMRDTKRDRRRQLRRQVLTPSASDWISRPLPDRLFPAYYLLRPARLARSYAFGDRRPGDVAE